MRPLLFEHNDTFWYKTYRILGHAAYGGADIGEVLATAGRITGDDYGSWHAEWLATARNVESEARAQLAAGHPVSARDGLFRAATYYRSAEFFLRDAGDDPRIAPTYESGAACFRDAVAQLTPRVEPIEIPFQGAALNGYLYHGADDGSRRPTLVMHNGFDGWAEELHHAGAAAAQERGYTVLIFDGPGQPGPRIRHQLYFRPDWEVPVAAVLDVAAGLAQVDASRIALLGNSMGGELAPRAAAFDDRIAALICIDAVYDVGSTFLHGAGLIESDLDRVYDANDQSIDAELTERMAASAQLRWAIRQGLWAFGVSSPRQLVAGAQAYHLRDGVAERITCPVLVGRAENDQFFNGQPEALMAHLINSQAQLASFTDAEGAGAHCQVGAQGLLSARMLDWLDDTFDVH